MGGPILEVLLAGSYNPLFFNFNRDVGYLQASGDEFSVPALVVIFFLSLSQSFSAVTCFLCSPR